MRDAHAASCDRFSAGWLPLSRCITPSSTDLRCHTQIRFHHSRWCSAYANDLVGFDLNSMMECSNVNCMPVSVSAVCCNRVLDLHCHVSAPWFYVLEVVCPQSC